MEAVLGPYQAGRELETLLQHAADLFEARLETLEQEARPFLTEVAQGIRGAQFIGWNPATRRKACRLLPAAFREAEETAPKVVASLRTIESRMSWTQTYDTGPVTDAFFDNYAHAPLVGPKGPACNGGIKLGALLQGPNTFYPAHAHPAGEFYLLLSGSPFWKIGDGHWHRKHPGNLIHHAPEVAHAMEATDSTMLALYAWYGAIHEPPRFV